MNKKGVTEKGIGFIVMGLVIIGFLFVGAWVLFFDGDKEKFRITKDGVEVPKMEIDVEDCNSPDFCFIQREPIEAYFISKEDLFIGWLDKNCESIEFTCSCSRGCEWERFVTTFVCAEGSEIPTNYKCGDYFVEVIK